MNSNAKDLTKEAPASPSSRVGGYVILARLADKARASFLGGNLGDYHTACPLDLYLLDWKGIAYDEIKREIVNGADDPALAAYLDIHGLPKTREEVEAWSDAMEAASMYSDPQKGATFAKRVSKLGLDPATTTTFQWLEADDKANASACSLPGKE